MKIRAFNKNDAKQCALIIRENKKFLGDLYSAQDLIKASSYNKYWVMVDGDKVMGIIGLTDLLNGIAMVATVCVSKKTQRQGIGRKLLGHVKQYCQNKKFRKILLLTHQKNKAMMILAIKEDFVPEGSLKNHFRDDKNDVIYFSYFFNSC